MIQRIQSFWLLLASASAFATFKFSYYSGTNAKGLSPYELKASENFLLLLTTLAVGGLALIAIFLFRQYFAHWWLIRFTARHCPPDNKYK